MIVFDLRCAAGHVFEARFASSASYEDQRARGFIRCPVCDSADIGKAVMAPNIAAKGSSAVTAEAAIARLAELQAGVISKSEWVGGDFAARARAMHKGDAPAALIHGETTLTEARALAEEGVAAVPLVIPFVPPAARN